MAGLQAVKIRSKRTRIDCKGIGLPSPLRIANKARFCDSDAVPDEFLSTTAP